MTADNERARLLEAAQRIQDQKAARDNALRTWMISRLGVGPGTTQAEQIIRSAPRELPQDLLHLGCQFELGLPANYSFSEDQLLMVFESQMPSAKL